MSLNDNWINNKLKGNFAEFIAKEHFRLCGYNIEPFGKEIMLKHLINLNSKNKMSFASYQNHKSFKRLPDLTISKSDNGYNALHLVEVKSKKIIKNWKNIQTFLYWDYKDKIFSARFMYEVCKNFNLPFDIWDSNILDDQKDFNIISNIIDFYIEKIKFNRQNREKYINKVITFYVVVEKPIYQESSFLSVNDKNKMPYVYLNATSDPRFIGAANKDIFEILGENSYIFNNIYIKYIHNNIKKYI